MEKFNKEYLEFVLPDKPFKELSKEYIIEVIFNEDIQKNWTPQIDDIIISSTGNIFVISNIANLTDKLGGRMYFFL